MKRIFSLLTVFVMVFVLSVPAMAYSYPDSVPVINSHTQKAYTIVWQEGGYTVVRCFSGYEVKDGLMTIYASSSDRGHYHEHDGDSWTVYTSTDQNGTVYWGDMDGGSPVWANFDIVEPDGTVIYEVGKCDGTTCPAHDVNVDGICDDCGFQLFNLRRSPVVPSVDGNNFHYALFSGTWDGQQGWYYVASTSSENYDVRGDIVGDYYKVTYDEQAESSMYISYDGINWEREAMNFTSSRFVPMNSTTSLLDSSHNWYDANGELFFPLPLWEMVERVTQGEMTGLSETMGGTMSTLVLCGVGCLVLLVVLKLFGKRSLLFLR